MYGVFTKHHPEIGRSSNVERVQAELKLRLAIWPCGDWWELVGFGGGWWGLQSHWEQDIPQ